MSLYLSQLKLDPRSRQVQAELRDPYQMHRTLSKAFGSTREEWEAARVLFRSDEVGGEHRLLVQSRTRPDWSRLTVSDGYLAAEPETKELNLSFRQGQLLRFRLRANPTKKVTAPSRAREEPHKMRVGLFGDEKQLAWLVRKGEENGFALMELGVDKDGRPIYDCRISGRGNADSRRPGFASSIRHYGVDFEGTLRVTDREEFLNAVGSGIGSAKGFGFGLLSLAPVR